MIRESLLHNGGLLAKDYLRLFHTVIICLIAVIGLQFIIGLLSGSSVPDPSVGESVTVLFLIFAYFIGLGSNYDEFQNKTDQFLDTLPVRRSRTMPSRALAMALAMATLFLLYALALRLLDSDRVFNRTGVRFYDPFAARFGYGTLGLGIALIGYGLCVSALFPRNFMIAAVFGSIFFLFSMQKIVQGIAVVYPNWESNYQRSVFYISAIYGIVALAIAQLVYTRRLADKLSDLASNLWNRLPAFSFGKSRFHPTYRLVVLPGLVLIPLCPVSIFGLSLKELEIQIFVGISFMIAAGFAWLLGFFVTDKSETNETTALLSSLPTSGFGFFYKRLMTYQLFCVLFGVAIYLSTRAVYQMDNTILFGLLVMTSLTASICYLMSFAQQSRFLTMFYSFIISTPIALLWMLNVVLAHHTQQQGPSRESFTWVMLNPIGYLMTEQLMFAVVFVVTILPVLTVFIISHSPLRQFAGYRRAMFMVLCLIFLIAVAALGLTFSPSEVLQILGIKNLREVTP